MITGILDKILAGAVVLLVVLGGILGTVVTVERHKVAAQEITIVQGQKDLANSQAQVVALKKSALADAAAYSALNAQNAKLKLEQSQTKGVLDEAIKAHPDWSNTPVPDDIFYGVYPEAIPNRDNPGAVPAAPVGIVK